MSQSEVPAEVPPSTVLGADLRGEDVLAALPADGPGLYSLFLDLIKQRAVFLPALDALRAAPAHRRVVWEMYGQHLIKKSPRDALMVFASMKPPLWCVPRWGVPHGGAREHLPAACCVAQVWCGRGGVPLQGLADGHGGGAARFVGSERVEPCCKLACSPPCPDGRRRSGPSCRACHRFVLLLVSAQRDCRRVPGRRWTTASLRHDMPLP